MTRSALPLALILLASPCAAAAQTQPAPAAAPAAAQEQAAPDVLYYWQVMAPDAVRAIQAKLRDAGAFSGAVDGVWRSDSAAALQSFQQTRGLQVTGQLNQATASVLGLTPTQLVSAGGSASRPPGPSAPPPQQSSAYEQPSHAPVPLSSNAIRAVQARLREAGFYAGGADGVWGSGSQDALLRLQAARGIPVTGRIDAASVRALGFDPDAFP
jgi:peptidoglycan hydrolase-like protein with peptidoglycan-binding domain